LRRLSGVSLFVGIELRVPKSLRERYLAVMMNRGSSQSAGTVPFFL
jgi:hypothetical protein